MRLAMGARRPATPAWASCCSRLRDARRAARCTTRDDAEVVGRGSGPSLGGWSTVPRPTPCRVRRCHQSVARWGASVQHLGLGEPRGAHGRFRPLVPVRTVLRPGPAVQPLRPRSALLHLQLLEPVARHSAARGGQSLPTQPWRAHGPRRALTALAHPPPPSRSSGDAAGSGRRKHRDASGFPWRLCRCSTACMDQRPRPSEPHLRARPECGEGIRAHYRAHMPTLWRSAGALGPPRLPAQSGPRAGSAP